MAIEAVAPRGGVGCGGGVKTGGGGGAVTTGGGGGAVHAATTAISSAIAPNFICRKTIFASLVFKFHYNIGHILNRLLLLLHGRKHRCDEMSRKSHKKARLP
ncbi:MAG: hypothetical protein AAGH53_11925 [Pseudomonadota bacterium]